MDVPGGTAGENPPAGARDRGPIPCPGGSHTPRWGQLLGAGSAARAAPLTAEKGASAMRRRRAAVKQHVRVQKIIINHKTQER